MVVGASLLSTFQRRTRPGTYETLTTRIQLMRDGMQANASEGCKLKAALALCFPRIPSSLLLEPVFVFTLVRIAYVQDTTLHTYRVLYEVILPHLLQSRCFAEAYEEAQCVFESIPLHSSHTWERVLCHTAFRHMLRQNGMTRGEIKVLWLRVREEIYKYFHAVPTQHFAKCSVAQNALPSVA